MLYWKCFMGSKRLYLVLILLLSAESSGDFRVVIQALSSDAFGGLHKSRPRIWDPFASLRPDISHVHTQVTATLLVLRDILREMTS